ncbi:hypothetical protein K458DRAFT_385568 [Lentithecium fluviatile CBS 122367]|uniref:Uncharacterized protein n=1 Tax=Lentithecium fluviatile CBS 122367 TaxID=1168545 RepID=A0A6G1JBU5_9PLEO|nr:hypothetical protein K458DRAFT_385568 [Lentithecium fluviatile CBS 122367]
MDHSLRTYFLIVSESEFYRLYQVHVTSTSKGEVPTTMSKFKGTVVDRFFFANEDTDFKWSRDCLGYWPFSPVELGLTQTADSSMASIKATLPLLSLPLLHAICGCLNYLLKHTFNPNSDGKSVVRIAVGLDVLLTSNSMRDAILDLILLRPIRLLNKMVFWACATTFTSTSETMDIDIHGKGSANANVSQSWYPDHRIIHGQYHQSQPTTPEHTITNMVSSSRPPPSTPYDPQQAPTVHWVPGIRFHWATILEAIALRINETFIEAQHEQELPLLCVRRIGVLGIFGILIWGLESATAMLYREDAKLVDD